MSLIAPLWEVTKRGVRIDLEKHIALREAATEDIALAQMKLDLFMKDLHLIQEAARAAGAALPLTDVAERLYAATQAAGHGAEDLAVVITQLQRKTREGSLDG